jgi:hypothetical protein
MRGFTAAQMRQVINVAASTSDGRQPSDHDRWCDGTQLLPGHGNFTGQMAARLVQSGFTGPRDAPSVTYGQLLADHFDLHNPSQVWVMTGRWRVATSSSIQADATCTRQSTRYWTPWSERPADACRRQALARVDIRGYKMVRLSGRAATADALRHALSPCRTQSPASSRTAAPTSTSSRGFFQQQVDYGTCDACRGQ